MSRRTHFNPIKRFTVKSKMLVGWVFVSLVACGPPEDALEVGRSEAAILGAPSSQDVTVQRNGPGRLLVLWNDWSGETGYQLLATGSTNPGLPFNGTELNATWFLVATLDANVTSHNAQALSTLSFSVCARDANASAAGDVLVQCTPRSARVTPEAVSDGASINELHLVSVTKSSIEVRWIESISTVRSEVSIAPGTQTVVNDPEEQHQFTNLQAGREHTITACAQSQGQLTAGTRSCRTLTVATLPNAPTGIDSLAVLPSTNPRARTIRFTDDNPLQSAASSYLVRLFPDGADTVLQEQVVNAGPGPLTRDVTFTGLNPFTAYEAWVIPRNVSGVGTAAGIGFTTPAEVVLSSLPLSGTSALLQFEAGAFGDYALERRGAAGFETVTRLRVYTPGRQRVVVEGMSAAQTWRVSWTLASLTSRSNELLVSRGPTGSPEVVSGSFGPEFPFGNLPLPLRVSATFRPTMNDSGKVSMSYVLVGDLLGGSAQTLAALSTGPFSTSQTESLSGRSSFVVSNPRVCRKTLTSLACSANVTMGTAGLLRVR